MRRKGQAAIDYLSTYGWALLALSAVLAALYLFVDFKPDTIIPESCDFGVEQSIYCIDAQINSATKEINISMKNTVGKEITVTNVVCSTGGITKSFGYSLIVPPSENFQVSCDMSDQEGVEFTKKSKVDVTLVYIPAGSIYPASADGYITTQPVK
jgi:hypothetical protein